MAAKKTKKKRSKQNHAAATDAAAAQADVPTRPSEKEQPAVLGIKDGSDPSQVAETSQPNHANGFKDAGSEKATAHTYCSHLQRFLFLALFVSSMGVGLAYCIQTIHDDYFVTLLRRAERTDHDLLQEFTYYDRECTMLDITASSQTAAHHLLHQDQRPAWKTMMRHGAVILPQLLSHDTIQDLREFVVDKNEQIKGTPSEYPVSQGTNRISYGIEATEHPAVIKALKEINAQKHLETLLTDLVGVNPSLSEITAITSSYGAPPQSWHPDTKPDGNALRFARTFMHSYSLFIPLQDTTKDMGATDICPGTQYCSDELHEICEDNAVSMSDINGVWRAGDAALLNQHIWHRGAAHVDKDALDRIMFIVTFLARPTAEDSRQLARGTYFHMKWNMWGHTWNDLKDCDVSMAWPFNILRCFHLWKPATKQWGYDLFTSAALRIANRQSGCEPEDLQTLLDTLDRIGFPHFLDGTMDESNYNAWHIYIAETVHNFFVFTNDLFWALVVLKFVSAILAPAGQDETKESVSSANDTPTGSKKGGLVRRIWKLVCQITFVIAFAYLLTAVCMDRIRHTAWSRDLESGRTLMRPFPPLDENKENSTVGFITENRQKKGLTTLPRGPDVLVGTRYTKHMGAYAHWLDFHPGNFQLNERLERFGGALYRSYRTACTSTHKDEVSPVLQQFLHDEVFWPMASDGGRFLLQDFETGTWEVMDGEATVVYKERLLVVGRRGMLFNVMEEAEFQTSAYRFGWLRGTAMSAMSQSYIQALSSRFLSIEGEITQPQRSTCAGAVTRKPRAGSTFGRSWNLNQSMTEALKRRSHHGPSRASRMELDQAGSAMKVRSEGFEAEPRLQNGLAVELKYDEYVSTIPATIISINPDRTANVAFTGESSSEFGSSENGIAISNIVPRVLLVEGIEVEVKRQAAVGGSDDDSDDDDEEDDDGEEEDNDAEAEEAKMVAWRHARVTRVYPDAAIDVIFDDEATIQRLRPELYRLIH